jgi:hypothetical protein
MFSPGGIVSLRSILAMPIQSADADRPGIRPQENTETPQATAVGKLLEGLPISVNMDA